jgi:hypothetical protein
MLAGRHGEPATGHAKRPHIYILLCMFNGFAFARPLCGVIKVILAGVEF